MFSPATRYETGQLAAEIFQTGSHTLLVSSGPITASCHAAAANQSASAGSILHHTAPALMTQRNRLSDRMGFLPPLMLQTVGSCGNGSPAAFVFHVDVEALIASLIASATLEVRT